MRLLWVSLFLATSLSCVRDVGEGEVAAKVEPSRAPALERAEPGSRPAVPGAAVDTLKVDVGRSKIEALGAKITATHPIVFGDFSGKVGVSEGSIQSLSFEVVMSSLESDHPKLTSHLKNEDFFDVETYPTASFVSSRVAAGTEVEGRTHTVTGDLTIRGKSNRVTFPATIEVTDREARADTVFVIDRQDFGVTYPGRPDDLVQDNVKMTISFVAPRK